MLVQLTDFDPIIKASNLAILIGNDNNILMEAVISAESEVKTYLFERYDVPTIFAKTGQDRHAYLVRIVMNVAMYILHKRLPKAIMPEHIAHDYDRSLKWLDDVANGRIAFDAERNEVDSKPYVRIRFGSNPPNTY